MDENSKIEEFEQPSSSSKAVKFRNQRITHWDRVSGRKTKKGSGSAHYHSLLLRYFKFLTAPGLRVLEVGCGQGDLLAGLDSSLGVGVDFSGEMLKRAAAKHPKLFFVRADAHRIPVRAEFDIIIMSDLINDLWDVQQLFENLQRLTHSGTRLILNFYNNLWRIPLSLIKHLGLGADVLEQNWFSPHDVFNLLNLAGFEVITRRPAILLPLRIPWLSALLNRYLVDLIPLRWLALTNLAVARPLPDRKSIQSPENCAVSVIIPARNEAGNIADIFDRMPSLGVKTELVFVEGQSGDNTYATIEAQIEKTPERNCKLIKQTGKGKGDAVRLGFKAASGDVLVILDADLTVPPEDLPRFIKALISGKGEFINGVRLVYPLEDQSMRFLNMVGNKFFSLVFSWLLGQPLNDTLCGTKVLWKRDYEKIAENRVYFGNFDPFGDFDLIFGSAKLNFKIVEIPIRYRSRTYGATNIDRWRHGWLLMKMVFFAAKRIKFI